MKLCAVYNVWGDLDLLISSVHNIAPVVDGIIIIASHHSNYDEAPEYYCPREWPFDGSLGKIEMISFEAKGPAMSRETEKRNFGLETARKKGFTHYLSMDADEFYDPEEFKKARQAFRENDSLAGLVCKSRVYFSRPDLTIGMDTTLVPFIHKITPTLRHEFNRKYPFAWEGKNIRIDPTRSFNIDSGVEMSPIVMEHFSWVRRDMEAYKRKIRNSTARANLERSNILQDLVNAKEGGYCEFYKKHLVRVPNRFNIPYGELLDEDIQPRTSTDA